MSEIKLFPHQIDVLEKTFEKNRVAYFLDMGLGKTFAGSEKLWQLNTPYNLLICQKSKIDDWVEHFKTYYPEYKVIKFDKQSLDIIPEESILVINYDKVWRRPELKRLSHFTLMLDESQYIRNKNNRRKFIMDLQYDNLILLSGTPTDGKYEKLWSQLHMLGWNISEDLYERQYVSKVWDDINSQWKIVGYKNVERLKRKMDNLGCVFMKTEEVFDLPKQVFVNVSVNSTKEYREFNAKHIVDYKGKLIIGDTGSGKRVNLRRLASCWNPNKVEKTKELIESTSDRVIVFYQYNEEYNVLKTICDELKRPISTINGQVKDKTAYNQKSDSVTLVQYQAGARGENLQLANKMIYFTPTDSVELWMQSKKRIHRIGQTHTATYYVMRTKNSIDNNIYNALEQGVDYTDVLFEKEYGGK